MKLTIELSEDTRVAITRAGLVRIHDEMIEEVDKAIQNGTPLTEVEAEDCISRKAVLQKAKSYNADGWDSYTPLVVDVEDIEKLPSVYSKSEPCEEYMRGFEAGKEYTDKVKWIVNSVLEDIRQIVNNWNDDENAMILVDSIKNVLDKHISGKE